MKILVIQLRQLGDILLTTPCLHEIRAAFPDAHLAIWTHRMGRLILDGNPHIDRHWVCDETLPLWEQLRVLREMRRAGYDLVIDYMNNPRSAIGAFLTGAPRRVGYRGARGWAYTERYARLTEPMYIVREKFDLLRRLGIAARDEALVLPWGEEHLGPARAMTNPDAPEWSAFASSSARVILSPTHRRPARRWPEASWAALADRLTRDWNAAVVWLWGPGEEAETRRVMALCRERTFQALPTKFREMAALVAQADLFVANSNGPSHVAVAVKTPSLQLHGPTNAISWCPLTPLHRAVQSAQDGRMEGISLDDVWRQLELMRPEIADHAARRRSSGQP